MIKLARPDITEAEIAAVAEVLRSGSLVQGDAVAGFETDLATVTRSPVVAVSNCTAALHLSLLAMGVGPGDRVLVSAYSWIASANVVEMCGAEPVFVDIDPHSFNMAPAALADRLSDHDDYRAAIFVHAFGYTDGVVDVAAQLDAAGIPLVEDAACAFGASAGGAPAGTIGRVGCFSFHPRKALTTGEGGAVVSDDQDLLAEVRSLRNHGIESIDGAMEFARPGLNCRMTDFQAALGRVQFARFGGFVEHRRRLAQRYDQLLAGSPVTAPEAADPAAHVFQSYVTLLPESHRGRVPEVVAALRSEGIETTIGTWHMPLSKYYRERYGYVPGDFPGTDEAFSRALSLPLLPDLEPEDQDRVVSVLLDVLAGT
jgi:dTDP-4-amino-4,6-dideoxygalactose transaminase